MFEPTPDQVQLLGYAVFLIPILVQGVRWIAKQFSFPLPQKWIEGVVVAFAVGFSILFAAPIFPAFPGLVATVAGIEALLAWGAAIVFVLQGFIQTTRLIYEYIWRRLVFDNVSALAGSNLH